MQLGLTILGLIVGCVAILLSVWLYLRNKKSMESNKKSTDKRLKDVKGRLESVEKKVGPIRHIRGKVGGKHKK